MRLSLPKTRRGRIAFSTGCLLLALSGAVGASTGMLRSKNSASPMSGMRLAAVNVSTDPATLETGLKSTMRPFLETYCIGCHGGVEPEAGLDMSTFNDVASVAKVGNKLLLISQKLNSGEMPPATAKQPPAAARQEAAAWVRGVSLLEAKKHAGDPGVVLAHRLSNAEYNYTIRDLTGVDIQPAKEFPIDPANQAGFDNSGESLMMDPALLKKYMEAAQLVANYMVMKTDGIGFAPHEAIAVTDRDKYCVNRIIAFYEKQPTRLANYFLQAWRYENRSSIGKPNATLNDFAADLQLSPKYLSTIYEMLNDKREKIGAVAGIQAWWRGLPLPDGKSPDVATAGCMKIEDFVLDLRSKIRPGFGNMSIPGLQTGSQPFVIWKDNQYEKTRTTYAPGAALVLQPADLAPGTPAAPLLAVPTDTAARDEYEAGFKHLCEVVPDLFFVPERSRVYLDPNAEANAGREGRLLSAGLHSQTGYFRDDRPLYDLILDKQGQKELDTMWADLDYIADAATRQFQSMFWFERSDSSFMKSPEFDEYRTEDKSATDAPRLQKLKDLWMAKARKGSSNAVALQGLSDYFDQMNATFRKVEQERPIAEKQHLVDLVDFAGRAYRRPLTQAEKDDLLAFYKTLRNDEHLEHEEAMRDCVVSILMSPYFTYHFTAVQTGAAAALPLTDYELASRLSYFLWSSMPDDELMKHAAAGDLHKPEVLLAQAKRMEQDKKIRGFATEFGGNWLDFRQFEQHNGVDRDRFKSFDNNLREAMYQEPIHFLIDLVRNDRSAMNFLDADYTFVNPQLAKHYGMPTVEGTADTWVKVENAHLYQRGGILPMAVFLTKNAPGLRTSPVKRGYWLVKKVLGEEIPPPPPNVPVLPSDESKLGDLTLPQLLAKHREDPNCATCHVHFDAIGLAFEGYGPIGDVRTMDMGGKPVQNTPTFRDGSQGTGLTGLRTYLDAKRKDDFLDNLCRKMLAAALGRTLILPDELPIEQMRDKLNANDNHISGIIETILTSPQFLNKRGQGSVQ